MKERSREMGSSPPTAEEIFRDYSARRSNAVHSLTNETSCDLLQERFRKENTSKYRRLCLTLAYLKPRNHRHQQLWLRSLSLSSIPPKFNYLSLLSLTQCVSILPESIVIGQKLLQASCKSVQRNQDLLISNTSAIGNGIKVGSWEEEAGSLPFLVV